MQVFKAYFKVIKKNIPSMLIYLFVFLALAVLFSTMIGKDKINTFTETKCRVTFFNHDKESVFIDSFKEYLSDNTVIINVSEETQKLQDALFYRDVEYIVKIPQGFTESLLNGSGTLLIEKTSLPDSISSMYVDFLINKYLNNSRLYAKNIPDISLDKIVSNVESDLKSVAKIKVNSYGKANGTSAISYYFIYLSYSLIAILFLGITSIMIVFNNSELKRRTLCSPYSRSKVNIQIVLGNLVFSVVVWLILIACAIPLYGTQLFTERSFYLVLNSFVFACVCLSIGFIIGSFIKNKNAQSAIANVLTLGLCFIGGVFVPQEFLGNTVRTIASFTPTYWYVKVIYDLEKVSELTLSNLKPIFFEILIQLIIAVGLLSIGLFVSRQRKYDI